MKSSLLSFFEAVALFCQEPWSLTEALIHGDTTEQFISGSLLLRPHGSFFSVMGMALLYRRLNIQNLGGLHDF